MAVGDVNGDGKLDLVIKSVSFLDSDAFQVGVLLGNGDGTFQAPLLGAAQPGGSGDLALGDFNNDGRMDAAVADQLGASSGNLSVFAGNGDGTFQSLIRLDLLTGGNDPLGVAAADLNGDGLVDLVAANASSSTVGVLVNNSTGTTAAKTSTTLSTSTATAVFGQRVTLTATVTSAAGVPTGTVTFRDGTTVLGTAPVNAAGQATLAVSLGVGNHALTASFAGTGGFADSTSAVAAVTVNRAATTVALGSSVNPAATGQAVTFTATVAAVAPGAGTPTGTVTFKDGNVILGTVAVGAGGTATFTTSFAAAGGHVITAVYSGDPNFVGSSQSPHRAGERGHHRPAAGRVRGAGGGHRLPVPPGRHPLDLRRRRRHRGQRQRLHLRQPAAPGGHPGRLPPEDRLVQPGGRRLGRRHLPADLPAPPSGATSRPSRQDFRVLVDGVGGGHVHALGHVVPALHDGRLHGRRRVAHDHLPGAGQRRRRQHRLHRRRRG